MPRISDEYRNPCLNFQPQQFRKDKCSTCFFLRSLHSSPCEADAPSGGGDEEREGVVETEKSHLKDKVVSNPTEDLSVAREPEEEEPALQALPQAHHPDPSEEKEVEDASHTPLREPLQLALPVSVKFPDFEEDPQKAPSASIPFPTEEAPRSARRRSVKFKWLGGSSSPQGEDLPKELVHERATSLTSKDVKTSLSIKDVKPPKVTKRRRTKGEMPSGDQRSASEELVSLSEPTIQAPAVPETEEQRKIADALSQWMGDSGSLGAIPIPSGIDRKKKTFFGRIRAGDTREAPHRSKLQGSREAAPSSLQNPSMAHLRRTTLTTSSPSLRSSSENSQQIVAYLRVSLIAIKYEVTKDSK